MNVFRRELRTLLTSPQAWAIATAYWLISGLFFVTLLFSRPFPDLERYYTNIETTLIVVAPIIAMRSFAEERRSGVLDITLSWPVSRWTVVFGKYLANATFVWVITGIVWLYIALLQGLGEVEVGKAAAGWIGLLMLTAMFNAIALAISAKSSSPTSAAFVGFGTLLGLWILDFVPGWLGGSFDGLVRFLAPTNHIENSGRGILDAGDALYFVMGTAFGLTLAGLALREPGRRGIAKFFKVRHAGVAAGLIVVLGTGIASAEARGQVDLTPERRFTLTPQSKAVLEQTKGKIRITGFAQPGTAQFFQIRSLVRRYEIEKSSVSLEIIDPDAQPGKMKQLGAGAYGQMLVRLGDRRELISDISEVDLTSAIQRLGRAEPPVACFTTGHGERSVDDERDAGLYVFGQRLKNFGYQVTSLALGAAGGAERLASCGVVVVAGPRAPFLQEELDLLGGFAQRQGRLVVMADVAGDDIAAQLNELIQPWGLKLRPGVVTDRSSLINDPAAVLAFKYPSNSPVTFDLRRQGIPVLLVGALAVESVAPGRAQGEDYAWLTPLVQSSSRSEVPDGTTGPFVLGAITDWSRIDERVGGPELSRTRIGVVGNVEFATNKYLLRFGNGTFATQLVSWVAIENDIVAASRNPGGATKLALTQEDRGRLVRSAVVAPSAVTLVLFVLALLRLRRS
jgi:ABC-type transport system involved in multi-copper enzyme maturation permease subunit